jgi:hypothetical protein
MGEIGKLLPELSDEDKNAMQWRHRVWTAGGKPSCLRVPIIVFDQFATAYKVTAIYEDEGFLCIDIEVPEEKMMANRPWN